jgi:hypothetical protein
MWFMGWIRRFDADYDFDADITKEEASNLIAQVKIFLHLPTDHLSNLVGSKI